MNNIKRVLIIFIAMLFLIYSGFSIEIKAADEQIMTIDVGPFEDSLEHEYTFNIPNLTSIKNITSDTGNVEIKSINGESVTLTVSNGEMKDAQEITRDIIINIPIPDRQVSLQIDDSSQMTNHSKIPEDYIPKIVSNGHYPRNENWYRWSQDPVTKKFRWTTDRYEVVGIKEEADIVIDNWKSQATEYVDADGYKANRMNFNKTNKAEWYLGYITSDGTENYEQPIKERDASDADLAGYMYLKTCTYNYTAHVQALGKKTIGSGYIYKLTIVYEGAPPTQGNNPPDPFISAPAEVVLGDDVSIFGYAYDPDGDPISYAWSYYPTTGLNGTLQGQSNEVWFSELGIYTINLTAMDDKGASGSTSTNIKVIPPIPIVNLAMNGTLKENRKIFIDASSSTGGSKRFPIDWSKSKWNVTAVSGGTSNDIKIQTHTVGSTDGAILYDSSRGINKPLDSLQYFDVLFKKPGVYKIYSEQTNTYGNSSSAEITLNIVDDIIPNANFSTPSVIYRDPLDNAPNGYAQATITLTDNGSISDGSYSSDNDLIQKHGYFIVFDINNNKSYNDDMVYIYDLDYIGSNQIPGNYSINTHWRPICLYKDINTINIRNINTGNYKSIIFKSTHIGKYLPGLFVLEEFGQEYIPQFTSINDRKSNYISK